MDWKDNIDYFYDKYLDVYRLEKKYNDEMFATTSKDTNKYNYIGSIICDIQPTSSEKVKQEYGYDIDVNMIVFYEGDLPIDIIESDVFIYDGNTYKMAEDVVKWDSYNIIFIKKELINIE